MASTYSTRLRIEKPTAGEQSGTWGTTVNTSTELLEKAIAGYLAIATADANVTLTTNNGSDDQSRYAILKLTGTNTATRDVIAPAVSKHYVIHNATTQSIRIKTASGTAVTVPTGRIVAVYCDGTDFTLVGAEETTNLTILNSVTPAADKLMYFTGASTGAVTDLTAFGRSLIDDADASAGRTTLGLVIGTNVQAYNANLAAEAGLTGAADVISYYTGVGAKATTSFTAFGRSLVDDADAATARATLGVSATAATLLVANNLSDLGSASTARTNLGLGSLATASTVNDANWSGTDLSVLNGGTGASTAAGARTNLGLVIGTDIMAYSAALAAIPATSPGADQFVYYTSATTAAVATVSSFARSLLDDADAAAMRTTLGVSSSGTSLQVANNLSDLNSVSTARTNLGLGTAAVLNTGTSGTAIPLLDGTNAWSGAQSFSYNATTVFNRSGSGLQIELQLAGTARGYIASDATYSVRLVNTGGTDLLTVANATGNAAIFGAITSGGVAVPTISSTSILTNKTLSSPTLSGTVTGSATWSSYQAFNVGAGAEALRVIGTSAYISMFNTAGSTRLMYARHNGSALEVVNEVSAGAIALSTTGGGGLTLNSVAIPTISSTDTLSNKTLSSPTLSGTVAGAPTWASAQTFPSNTTVGANSGNAQIFLNGGTTSGAGAGIAAYGSGVLKWVLNSYSGIVGGTYDSDPTFYNSVNTGAVYIFDAGNKRKIATVDATETFSNKTLSSPTLSGTVAGSPTFSGATVFSGDSYPIRMNDGGYIRFYNASTGVDWALGKPDATSLILYRNGTPSLQFDASGSPFMYGVAIPTISSTDTLSNKTLSSPTLSGTVAGSPTASGTWTFPSTGIKIAKPSSGSTLAGDLIFDISGDLLRVYENGSPYKGFTVDISAMDSQSALATIATTQTFSNKTLSSPTLSGTVAGSPTASGTWTFTGNFQILNTGQSSVKLYRADGALGYTFGRSIGTDNAHNFFLYDNIGVATVFSVNSSQVVDFAVAPTAGGVAIPTISSTSTLSNKTLSSPTLSGTVAGSVTFSGNLTFTGTTSISINTTEPRLDFYETNAGSDAKRWSIINDGGAFGLQTRSDADVFGQTAISISRSGTTVGTIALSGAALTFGGVEVPTISSTSTFTNKTLTSPTINGGSSSAAIQDSSETTGALTSASANKRVICSGNVTLPASGMTSGGMVFIDPAGTARTVTRPASHTMYVNDTDSATATTKAHNVAMAVYHGSSKWTLHGTA